MMHNSCLWASCLAGWVIPHCWIKPATCELYNAAYTQSSSWEVQNLLDRTIVRKLVLWTTPLERQDWQKVPTSHKFVRKPKLRIQGNTTVGMMGGMGGMPGMGGMGGMGGMPGGGKRKRGRPQVPLSMSTIKIARYIACHEALKMTLNIPALFRSDNLPSNITMRHCICLLSHKSLFLSSGKGWWRWRSLWQRAGSCQSGLKQLPRQRRHPGVVARVLCSLVWALQKSGPKMDQGCTVLEGHCQSWGCELWWGEAIVCSTWVTLSSLQSHYPAISLLHCTWICTIGTFWFAISRESWFSSHPNDRDKRLTVWTYPGKWGYDQVCPVVLN